MTGAVIYARYSPRPQIDGKECESNEKQIERCESYCRLRELSVIGIYTDAKVSGRTRIAKRPGGKEMLESLKPGTVIVVACVDRLFRNAGDALVTVEKLNDRDIGFHFVDEGGNSIDTTTPVGFFILGQLALKANFDRMTIGRSTSRGMKRRQKMGDRMSHKTPFGKKVDPNDPTKLVDSEQEILVIEKIVSLKNDGHSYTSIAKCLGQCGFKPRGKAWYPKTIERILKNQSSLT